MELLKIANANEYIDVKIGGNTMTYTITNNAAYNSLEISFDGKPSEEIRDMLKSYRFRWHGQKRVWYGYADEETIRKALESGQMMKATEEIKKPEPVGKKYALSKEDREEVRANYAQIWPGDDHMIDYCTNQVNKLLRVGDMLVIFEKIRLETSFCFGYGFYGVSTVEEDRAAASQAAKMRSDESRFIEENTKRLKEEIAGIRYILACRHHEEVEMNYQYDGLELIFRHSGFSGENSHNLTKTAWVKRWETIEKPEDFRIATDEEALQVVEVLEEQLREVTKRCETYLKKYGTSKLNVWTYLRD